MRQYSVLRVYQHTTFTYHIIGELFYWDTACVFVPSLRQVAINFTNRGDSNRDIMISLPTRIILVIQRDLYRFSTWVSTR